jgi:hypothetical protein
MLETFVASHCRSRSALVGFPDSSLVLGDGGWMSNNYGTAMECSSFILQKDKIFQRQTRTVLSPEPDASVPSNSTARQFTL